MLFNSFEFMAFMALALILFYATRIYKVRRILLIVASYIFYGAWNPPYLLLLAGTTLLDFSVAKRMDRVNSAAARRFLLISSITFNLVLLGSFKYGEFLVGNLNLVLSGLGLPGFEYRPGTLSWTAPPMISIRKKHIMARPIPAADDPSASICSDSR